MLLCDDVCAVVRGWLSRVHMRRLKRERMRAAVVIQAGNFEYTHHLVYNIILLQS